MYVEFIRVHVHCIHVSTLHVDQLHCIYMYNKLIMKCSHSLTMIYMCTCKMEFVTLTCTCTCTVSQTNLSEILCTCACACTSLHTCTCTWVWVPLPYCWRVGALVCLCWHRIIELDLALAKGEPLYSYYPPPSPPFFLG